MTGAEPLPLGAVTLTSGPFARAQERALRTALELDPDRLLAPFRREAAVPTGPGYGGGEAEGLDGHTLGHAIEHAERYRWRHGAAISIGMMYVAELSRLAGRLSDEDVARHRRIFDLLGLPTTYRMDGWQHLLGVMQRDKKARAGMLRFIVLDAIGKPTVMQAPDESLLFAAYQEIAG